MILDDITILDLVYAITYLILDDKKEILQDHSKDNESDNLIKIAFYEFKHKRLNPSKKKFFNRF
jgi:hypothetical protein